MEKSLDLQYCDCNCNKYPYLLPVGLADHVEAPLSADEVVGDDGGAAVARGHAVGRHAEARLGGAATFVNLSNNIDEFICKMAR